MNWKGLPGNGIYLQYIVVLLKALQYKLWITYHFPAAPSMDLTAVHAADSAGLVAWHNLGPGTSPDYS